MAFESNIPQLERVQGRRYWMRVSHQKKHTDFDGILDADAPVEVFASGFQYTEGPVWLAEHGELLFSDIVGNAIYRAGMTGEVITHRSPSGMANGNTRDRQGRILTCEHAGSRVVREAPDGRLIALACAWQGKELNSPNDIVVDSRDRIYFTDPTYGRMAKYGIERPQSLGFQGVFRINPDTSELSLIADDFDQPNGLCLALDETRLYVSDTKGHHIRVFDIATDGSVTGGEAWATLTGEGVGLADGLKFDSRGNLYSCGPGGIHVFSPEAELLGVIATPMEPTNFEWGGVDLKTLYITGHSYVYQVSVNVRGRSFVLTGPDGT